RPGGGAARGARVHRSRGGGAGRARLAARGGTAGQGAGEPWVHHGGRMSAPQTAGGTLRQAARLLRGALPGEEWRIALGLLVVLVNVAQTAVLVSTGLRLVFKLRCALFDHVQALSLAFHDATPVGDSLYRVTWDTYCVQTLFNGGLVPAVTAAVTLGGITA